MRRLAARPAVADTRRMQDTRVTLSRVQRADAAEIMAANLASRSYHAPWVQPCTDQAGFDAWMARLGATHVSLLAREAASGGICGVVNFSQIAMGNFCSAFCGFYGMAAFAGQGLMTQALRLGLAVAFGELGLHRVEANIQPGNARSQALVQRLGFAREGYSPRYLNIDGVWRDHERWAIVCPADR
jgi:ribosomal-protein-alanine N-acetyltransferase